MAVARLFYVSSEMELHQATIVYTSSPLSMIHNHYGTNCYSLWCIWTTERTMSNEKSSSAFFVLPLVALN